MLKIDYDTPYNEFKKLKNYDIAEVCGKQLVITHIVPDFPRVIIKKTSKSKGRPLTRASDINASFLRINDSGKYVYGDDKYSRLGWGRGIDKDGVEWTFTIDKPGYVVDTAGSSQDPWTVYVAAYRDFKQHNATKGTQQAQIAAEKALWSEFKNVKAIDTAVKLKKSDDKPYDNIYGLLRWVTTKRPTILKQVIQFLKNAKGIDFDKMLDDVYRHNKQDEGIAKYAEKHPELFAW